MKPARLLAGLILIATATTAFALEIPLGGASEGKGAGGGGTSVGYVDMDRIFQIYPQTQIAKEDYAKQLEKKRQQLREKEEQVNSLKARIGVLDSTLKDMGAPSAAPATSSDTATSTAASAGTPADAGSAQGMQDMKKQLEQQMGELDDMRKQAETDLAAFQAQQSQIILGKIYQALKDLAQEEQVTLIVDKSSILYGDAAVDLTEKLQEKVRGY
jgi:Skp family chaperone for outer membrane proteins